jgi:hypothetical protein
VAREAIVHFAASFSAPRRQFSRPLALLRRSFTLLGRSFALPLEIAGLRGIVPVIPLRGGAGWDDSDADGGKQRQDDETRTHGLPSKVACSGTIRLSRGFDLTSEFVSDRPPRPFS